jgi:outer membrane protein TolC
MASLIVIGVTPVLPARDLALSQAIAYAETHDHSLQSAEAQIEALEVARKHPENWRQPELRYGKEFENDSGDQTRYALRLRPPNFFRSSAERRVVETKAQVVLSQLADDRMRLRLDVSHLYFRALYFMRLSELARNEVQLLGETLASYREQLTRGNVRLTNALDAQSDFAEARILLSDVEQEKREALIKLFDRIGLVWDPDFELATPFDPVPGGEAPTGDFGTHDSLRAWQLKQKEVDEQIRRERKDNYPSVSFVQGFYDTDVGRNDENQWGFGLGIEIPIFNRNKREIAELQAKKKDLISGEQALRKAITTSRNLATQNLLEARRLVIDLTEEASGLDGIYGDEKLIAAMTINEERKLKVAQLNFERAVLRARYDYQVSVLTYHYLAGSTESYHPNMEIETPVADRTGE